VAASPWALALGLLAAAACCAASDLDEFRVKRRGPFEFAQKPTVERDGDRVTIRFETRALSDVTIAIEEADGAIIRHLGSGVLGPSAPEPFQPDTRKQAVVWDGKNDQGVYIDRKDELTVRVSVGLKPRFERNLFHSPYKRNATGVQVLAATPEGVLVYEGRGHDHIVLYDHEGTYIRTVYPFPANKVDEVVGIERRKFPQDGKTLPVKKGFVQASLLTSGTSHLLGIPYKMGNGFAAVSMAAAKGRIALAYDRINRLAMDGTTGGADLTGPQVSYRVRSSGYGGYARGINIIGPQSIALSPDAKTLYMTGYMWFESYHRQNQARHGVLKVAFDRTDTPALFVGDMQIDKGAGADNRHFRVPTSVAVDAKGRVYVSDFLNNRVQVYGPDAAFLKSIPVKLPAQVCVSPKTGEIWVFSYPIYGASPTLMKAAGQAFDWRKITPTVTRFGPFEDPKKRAGPQPVPMAFDSPGFFLSQPMVNVAVDWWAEAPTIWVAARKYNVSRVDVAWGGIGAYHRRENDPWLNVGVKLYGEHEGAWRLKRSFAREARKRVVRLKPGDFSRERLYVNPGNRLLHLAEDLGFGKSFKQMLQIDPETGRVKTLELPFDTEDIAFDMQGRAYLRTDRLVVRYDTETWQEVPWDYGEEHVNVGFSSLGGGHRADVKSALRTPGQRPVCWHAGGISISPTGLLAVACCSRASEKERGWMDRYGERAVKPYTPTMFPGRSRWGEVHVWDRYGRKVHLDAIPGIRILNGVHIDRNGDLYVMAAKSRVLDGTPYFNEMEGTLIKAAPASVKIMTSGRASIPLPKEMRPKRPQDLRGFWIERDKVGGRGAKWLYGGVGFGGFNPAHSGGGCACWNARFDMDYFARSFAPEIGHCSVAVLDMNGNLILRVGAYGNLDDGVPLDRKGGPPNPRSIGGDEVALFYAPYVATDTDRRLFIADPGNGRILGVRLDYHATERVALKDVGDHGD